MSEKRNIINDVVAILQQNTRGVQIGIYTIAGVGLALAVHKVRPVSKFSRIADIPEHFIKNKEILKGRVVGWVPSTEGPQLLVDHSPLLRIPFWHSGKPALPVQVWGVKLVGGNGVSWLQCVAVGQMAELTPIARGANALIADVSLNLPVTVSKKIDKKKKQKAGPQVEILNVGESLVELGLGVVSTDVACVPIKADSKWFWLPWIFYRRTDAEILQRAQSRAMAHRAGLWRETVQPSRLSMALQYIKSLVPTSSKKKVPTSSVL